MTAPDDDLPALRAPPTGRKSDDAFARSVRADVDAARAHSMFSRRWLAAPALVAAAAAVFVIVGRPAGSNNDGAIALSTFEALAGDDDGSLATIDVDGFDDDTLIALADDGDEDREKADDTFAIPALDGSSPGELARIEAALDRALKL